MALTTASDISIVFSGGSSNLNPNNSLGGDPSSNPITTAVLNNLFDDVSSEESKAGVEDYRCVYIFNDGETTVYSIKIWIDSDLTENGGSIIELGIEDKDEKQRITVSGEISDGNFVISYLGSTAEVEYDPDLSTWANSLQEAIESLQDETDNPLFTGVTVIAANSGNNSVIFDITFGNFDGSRNFEEILIEENNLEPEGITVSTSVIQNGSPINTIASEIDVDTTPPGNVVFSTTSLISPIFFPYLNPDEGFPLWIKRTTLADTTAQENDGFILGLRAESLRPTV